LDEELKRELHARLEADRDRLNDQIVELRDYAIKATTYLEDENDTADNHPADDASSLVERQTDMSLLHNLEREMMDIHQALNRMDDGTYGMCEVCGKPIADKRLLARPMATTCIQCQSTIEARQRQEAATSVLEA
jgi:RNA polymerase-binding protein DksA